MDNIKYTFDNVESYVSRTLGISEWHEVGQEEINAFGQVTHDPDPNHIDPVWAKQHSPYGSTITFGFQTLALLTYLCKQAGFVPAGTVDEYNYGFDSIRFIAPVHAGARIRANCRLDEVRRRGPHHKILKVAVKVEIEGRKKPALVAEWLVMCGNKVVPRESIQKRTQSEK